MRRDALGTVADSVAVLVLVLVLMLVRLGLCLLVALGVWGIAQVAGSAEVGHRDG